jgi:hypothetical protein
MVDYNAPLATEVPKNGAETTHRYVTYITYTTNGVKMYLVCVLKV